MLEPLFESCEYSSTHSKVLVSRHSTISKYFRLINAESTAKVCFMGLPQNFKVVEPILTMFIDPIGLIRLGLQSKYQGMGTYNQSKTLDILFHSIPR